MQDLLEAFGLDEQFSVVQADAMKIRHEACGEIVRAETADLHLRGCEG